MCMSLNLIYILKVEDTLRTVQLYMRNFVIEPSSPSIYLQLSYLCIFWTVICVLMSCRLELFEYLL